MRIVENKTMEELKAKLCDGIFTLQSKADDLSETAKRLLDTMLADHPVQSDVEKVRHTAQVFSSRTIRFSEDGKAVIESVYTDVGQKVLSLFDYELEGKTKRTFSYQIVFDADGGCGKIILLTTLGLPYGEYLYNSELTTLKTADILSNEIYTNNGENITDDTSDIIPANTFNMAKIGCWYMWLQADGMVSKWDESCGKRYTDIRYGDKERNVFDLYVPLEFNPQRENGIIVFIHGGAWIGGDKSLYEGKCNYYAKQGYFTATMNYSFIDFEKNSTMFTIFDEVLAAIAKIKELSDENGWNITKAACSGESAGAHISMMHAYSNNDKGAIPVLFVAEQTGPIDMSAEAWAGLKVSVEKDYLMFVGAGIGKKLNIEETKSDKYDDLIKAVSPINFVKTAVPTIMGHGMYDEHVRSLNGRILSNDLSKHGIRNDYVEYPNCNHGLVLDAPCGRKFNQLFKQYLEDYFGY